VLPASVLPKGHLSWYVASQDLLPTMQPAPNHQPQPSVTQGVPLQNAPEVTLPKP
jgi:hypothetical protein